MPNDEAVPAPEPKVHWLEANILTIRDLMHPVAVHQMLETAEAVGQWRAGMVYKADCAQAMRDETRVCQVQLITKHVDARFERWESAMHAILEHATRVYFASNAYIASILEHSEDHGYELCRYAPGGKFGEHVDTYPRHPNKRLAARMLSFIFFLNEGYEGGVLGFPRQKHLFTPSIGSCVVFPAHYGYPNEEWAVRNGTKYTVTSWLAPPLETKEKKP